MLNCRNCGAQMPDGTNFCPVCGAAVQNGQMNPSGPMQGNTWMGQAQQPAGGSFGMQPVMNGYGNMQTPQKNHTALIACIVAAVAVIALAAVLLVVFVFGKDKDQGGAAGGTGGGGNVSAGSESGTGSYTDAAENFLDGFCSQDLNAACMAAPSELRRDLKKAIYSEFAVNNEDELWEELRDYYGNNLKISYSYSEKEKMDPAEIEEYLEYYLDYRCSVSECVAMEYDITYAGSEDRDSEDIELLAVKIDGKWYIVDVDF